MADLFAEMEQLQAQQAQQPTAQPQAAPIQQAAQQQPPQTLQPSQQGGGVDLLAELEQKQFTDAQAAQPQPEESREIVGGLEAAGTILSSAIAEPIAGLAGLITSPFVGINEATRNIQAVKDFITITPETSEGKRNLKAIGDLVGKGVDLANIPTSGLVGIGEILSGQGIDQAASSIEKVKNEGLSGVLGQRVLDATGSPELAAIAHSLPTAALEALGVKGLNTAKLSGARLSSDIAEAIQQAAPDIKTLKARVTSAYKDLDTLGIRVQPKVYESFANTLSARLKKEGIDPILHPKSSAVINRIMDDIGQSKRPSELETLRKIAQGAAASIEKPDARLGTMIINEIDKGLDSLSSQVGGKFKEARALSQRTFKSQAITDMIENATHTASGMENGLRIEARKILKNKKKSRGFTIDEMDALKQIEEGTTAANAAKFLGKFGISEGQATSMLGASIGIGGGGALGAVFGPIGAASGALTVPAVGQLAKKTAQRITLNNTKFSDDLVRAGKDAREITKAYLRHTPKDSRRVSDLTDIFLDANLSPADIKRLPLSKTSAGKLAADAAYFAKEINRRIKQAGSAGLIVSPSLEEQE